MHKLNVLIVGIITSIDSMSAALDLSAPLSEMPFADCGKLFKDNDINNIVTELTHCTANSPKMLALLLNLKVLTHERASERASECMLDIEIY